MMSLPTESMIQEWSRVDFITCAQCLARISEHFHELLTCLYNSTGEPDKNGIYKQCVKVLDEACNNDEHRKKEMHKQLRKLINAQFIETAQHICQSEKNKFALQSIAHELLLLPELVLVNKNDWTVSFRELERFIDVYGSAQLSEYGRRVIQSSDKHSLTMIRGQNLYALNDTQTTFEIRLQIEQFHSSIYIGVCSHNASPVDIEKASNTFPVNPSQTAREGDIFHLLIDVHNHEMYLHNEFRSSRYQNREQKKRHRIVSKWKCPLPWRFFVILTDKSNRVRIVY